METALLERIATKTEKTAKNTEQKSSFYILLSEKSTHIKTKFRPLIQLDKSRKYEMALVNLETYYSFPTVLFPFLLVFIFTYTECGKSS